MKHVKPMLWAAVLSLALSISAYAGDIQSPGYSGPGQGQKPPPATCTCEEELVPSTESVDTTSTKDASAPEITVTSDFTFYILLGLLSFF